MTVDEFVTIALSNRANHAIVQEIADLSLPDAWLVSACLVQTVWNSLTGRALTYGIKDYDVFYFDPDTSWEAEDAIIRRLDDRLGGLGVEVEARNQARVHLWYQERHGLPYPALRSAREGIDRFLTANTQIGIRRGSGGYEIYAPRGVDDAVNLVVRPNPTPNFSARNYLAKASRWKQSWPEITILRTESANIT